MVGSMTTPEGVSFLRTADSAFADLEGYPFAPNYFVFEGLRLHYIAEGPRDGPTALLMHGMPTWSYLNRHIVSALVGQGWRCIAADHIGFGKSDKVTDESWYSIARHTRAHRALIEHLDLGDVTLLCQDWGGPIGLAQAADMPERFGRLVIMNTWLHHEAYGYTPALRLWNGQWQPGAFFDTLVPDRLQIGDFMMVACRRVSPEDLRTHIATGAALPLSPEQDKVRQAYSAPFEALGRAGHAGPRRFPLSLPFDNPEGGNAAEQARHFSKLKDWKKPAHFIWGGRDDVFTEAWGRQWAAMFAQSTFDLIPDAGHFLQETHADEIVRAFIGHAN